jgi:hypothetical protein
MGELHHSEATREKIRNPRPKSGRRADEVIE